MGAAQLAQRGLDGGGQRGLALAVDGGTAESGNLGDICGCGLDMHAAADQARAYLRQVEIVQIILAGANQGDLLARKLLARGDARGKTGSRRQVPNGIAPCAQQLTLFVLGKADLHKRGAYAELFCGAHARAVVTAIACIAAIDDGGKAERLGVVDDGGKAGLLTVVAAIGIVAGYLGELQLIDRKIEHRELKMRLLIGLPVNGPLKRSLFRRADERRGEVNEKRAGRHDAGADRG